MDEIKFTPSPHREVVRIFPDGTAWVAPDITPDEAKRTIEGLATTAGAWYRKSRECDQRHTK
jgi:hypothetical protein